MLSSWGMERWSNGVLHKVQCTSSIACISGPPTTVSLAVYTGEIDDARPWPFCESNLLEAAREPFAVGTCAKIAGGRW